MNIFVINAGSSSLKYQLIQLPQAHLWCSGLVERIGQVNAQITHKVYQATGQKPYVFQQIGEVKDHQQALAAVSNLLVHPDFGVIQSPDEIKVIGHRVVHGGEHFAQTTIINQAVKAKIKSLFPLAPLHNPAHYVGIEVAENIFTSATQIAVFDTAFHQTMPAVAYRYAIPQNLYEQYGIRAYGFHGTSHKYVSAQAMQYLNNSNARIITIHLGNGCSMSAVKEGKCVDTSMGMGPLSGLMMGTRSGDIDPSVLFYLVNEAGYTFNEVNNILNKQSGLLGLVGSSDMRDVKQKIQDGDEQAQLAYAMYAYRIKKYIGAYAAVLNGVDAVVFTAGVGENDADIRQLALQNLDYLGIELAPAGAMRKVSDGISELHKPTSKVKVLVIATNEELEIANQCYQLMEKDNFS